MVDVSYVPQRGDLIWIQLNPQLGHEQAGRRPVLVLSPTPFNRFMGLAIVCAITSRSRPGWEGFQIPLPSALKTRGLVLVHQIRCIAYRERGAEFIETAPASLLEEVMGKLSALVIDE